MRMPLQPSPLGGIAQRVNDTMMKFFLSQPGPLERDYMQAGVDQRRAAIETERAKAALEQQKFAAPGLIASAFQNVMMPPEVSRPDPSMVGPMPQMSRDDVVRQEFPRIAQGAAALDVGDIGNTFLALMANAPGTSNEAVTRAFAGSGRKLGVNDALLPERQDQLRTENFGQETSLNNADNAAAMARQSSANATSLARGRMAADAMRPTTLARLLSERNALAPDDPNRVIYDNMISKQSSRGEGLSVELPDGTRISTAGAGKKQVEGLMEAEEAASDWRVFSQETRELASNPANFGAAGLAKGWGQEAAQQMMAAGQMLGLDPGAVEGFAHRMGIGDYDPSLAQLEARLALAVYKAGQLVGQSGRDFSDRDAKVMQRVIGSPLRSQADLFARLDVMDQIVDTTLGVKRDAIVGKGRIGTSAPAAQSAPVAAPPAQPAPSAKPRIKIDAQGRIIP